MMRRILLIGALLVASGCAQRDKIPGPHAQYPGEPPAAPVSNHEAALMVSDLKPQPGNLLVVAGTLPLSDSLSIGSFVARLSYDAAKLHYLGESDADEMMRVVNAEQGKLTVAAASGSGSKTGRLFTFKFRVDDPAGLESLMLSMDELNDTKYVSRLSLIHTRATPQLDKTLAPKRVNTQ